MTDQRVVSILKFRRGVLPSVFNSSGMAIREFFLIYSLLSYPFGAPLKKWGQVYG